jgi:FKBP-type peptidyl-prolyl cis-trans isomerase
LLVEEQEAAVPADLSAEKNAEYLAANAKKAGVTVTESGLQYRELTAGTGKQPGLTSQVTVHYKGTFINGKEFDSSLGGEPITFSLTRVIAGWTEGLQMMREGGKAELVVPQDLAYGPGRQGIPPYQTLVFQVELLKVQ